MNTIQIEVLNPASLSLLKELEKLKLISIHKTESTDSDFMDFVHKLRSKSHDLPSLEEITAEVEQQRSEMYAISSEEDKGHHRY